MATSTYEVNYEDERFAKVESDKQEALTDLEQTYGGMTDESDKYYQAQIDASKQWADKQSQLQQEQTDFTIEQIEQQKDQTHKDYLKEQSGAYVDWQKQSNQYGADAEKMASAGMAGTGYSESSQVSMYNTYQNRVASARESYSRAVLNYDNAIKEARLQNNAALAEIAFQSLQQQLELSLQGFQYKNQLILDQANKKAELDNTYYNRYLDVLNQINTEKAFDEQIRQYNQNYELQVKQHEEAVRQFNQEYELQVKQFEEGIRQFNEEIERLKNKDAAANALQIQQLELERQQLEAALQQALLVKPEDDEAVDEGSVLDDSASSYAEVVKSLKAAVSGGSVKNDDIIRYIRGKATSGVITQNQAQALLKAYAQKTSSLTNKKADDSDAFGFAALLHPTTAKQYVFERNMNALDAIHDRVYDQVMGG